MNLLDTGMIALSYVINSAICAVVMGALWFRNHRRSPALGFWLAAYIMQCGSILLITLRTITPDTTSHTVSNVLSMGAMLVIYIGLARYVGETGSQRHNYLLLAVCALLQIFFAYMWPSLQVRDLTFSLAILIFALQGAWLMVRQTDPDIPPAAKSIGVILLAFALSSVVRVVSYVGTPLVSSGLDLSLYGALALLTYQALFIALTFTLFLMVNHRLLTTLERDLTARSQVEQSLRLSETTLRVLMDAIHDSILLTELDGTIVIANSTVAERFNRPMGELQGRSVFELLPLAVAEYRRSQLQVVLRTGEPVRFEDQRQGHWIDNSIYPVFNERGLVTRVAIFGRDITAIKRTEEALREHEANLTALIDNTDSSIWSIDPDYHLIIGNYVFHEHARAMFGHEFARGDHVLLHSTPQVRAVWRAYYDRALRGEQLTLEIKHSLVDQAHWTEYRLSPILSDRRILGVTIMGRDITASKLVESALREAEQRFRNMFERHQAIMVLIEPRSGAIVDVNPAAAQFYGYSIDDMRGMGHDVINSLTREQLAKAREQALTEQRNYFIFPHRLASGEIRTVEAHSTPIMFGDRMLLFSIIYDITARTRAEEDMRASEERYRILFELESDAIFLIDNTSGEILEANTTAITLYGYSRDELLAMRNTDLSAQRDETKRAMEERHTSIPLRHHRKKDGTVFPVEITANHLTWRGRECHIAAIRDISERKRMEAAEREQRALAEALRDTAAVLSSTLAFDDVLDRILDNVGRVVPHDAANIMLVDPEGYLVSIARSRGYTERDAHGIAALQFPLATMPILSQMARSGQPVVIADTQADIAWFSATPTFWVSSYAGAPIRMRERLIGFLNLDSARPGFFARDHAERLQSFADQAAIAIENARLYAEVQAVAITDPLTGVFNRRGLLQLGEREVERALRFHTQLAAVMLDVDHFKRINDAYGHPIGDRVLHALATCCRGAVRSVDLVARYGGEEFVLLLPETDLATAAQVAERLRQAVEQLVVPEGLERLVFSADLYVTVSLGVSVLTPDMPDLAALIARADQALYAAKQAGRNCVVLSE